MYCEVYVVVCKHEYSAYEKHFWICVVVHFTLFLYTYTAEHKTARERIRQRNIHNKQYAIAVYMQFYDTNTANYMLYMLL